MKRETVSSNQPLKYIDPSGETEEEFCENVSTAFSRYGEQFIESISSPQNWGLWALDGSSAALEVYYQGPARSLEQQNL